MSLSWDVNGLQVNPVSLARASEQFSTIKETIFLVYSEDYISLESFKFLIALIFSKVCYT